MVDSVRTRTGRLIDSQEQLRDASGRLPGIDDLTTHHRPEGFDSDGDGMPDDFEQSHELNPEDPLDGRMSTLSSDGYSNLEVYLNSLVK